MNFVFDACGAGVLAESVTLVGDAGKVITIADPSFARQGVRFTGMSPEDRFPEALPQLADLIATAAFDLPVWRAYPLGEARPGPRRHRNPPQPGQDRPPALTSGHRLTRAQRGRGPDALHRPATSTGNRWSPHHPPAAEAGADLAAAFEVRGQKRNCAPWPRARRQHAAVRPTSTKIL
ncbi:hypothetical protein ACWDRB_45175 [Nonomuraea sp. NPDC003707]